MSALDMGVQRATQGLERKKESEMFESLRIRRSQPVERRDEEVESTPDTSGLSFTGRIANWGARHSWWVLAATVLVRPRWRGEGKNGHVTAIPPTAIEDLGR